MNYYYTKGGDTLGPATLEEIREMYRRGELPSGTQVRKEGDESWQPLSAMGPNQHGSSLTAPKYFVSIDQQMQGPYNPEQIRAMLQRGAITLATLALPEDGRDEWVPIASIPGLTDPAKSTAPPLRAYELLTAELLGLTDPAKPTAPPPPTRPTPPSSVSRPSASPSSSWPPPDLHIQQSGIATVLQIIGTLEIIAAPIAGLVIGTQESAVLGGVIFASSILGGIFLFGFARVIDYLYEAVQRLRQIAILLSKGR